VINKFLESRFEPPRNLEELAGFVAHTNRSSHTLLLAIFLKSKKQHIGNIKLGPINRTHRLADVGFLIGNKENWGKGYASRAIRLVCDYGFGELGLEKITAGCYAENAGSRSALLKAGFCQEGRLLSQWTGPSGRSDGIIFGKVRPVGLAQ